MPEIGQDETVRFVALDRSFHVQCYKCEVSKFKNYLLIPYFQIAFVTDGWCSYRFEGANYLNFFLLLYSVLRGLKFNTWSKYWVYINVCKMFGWSSS